MMMDDKKGEEGFEDDNELEVPVCSKCFSPCTPGQDYCSNCDSNEVINPLASYMPFVRIRFSYGFFGKMWRKIWYDKKAGIFMKLVCAVLIVVFAPILIIVGLPVLLMEKMRGEESKKESED